jgi:hypothetical protein
MTDTAVGFKISLVDFLLTLTPEELLIDFCELIGKHSGENMAAVLWSTLELYGLQSKVQYLHIHSFICSAEVILGSCHNDRQCQQQ